MKDVVLKYPIWQDPYETKDAAMGALKFLIDMGLFTGQSPAFFAFMQSLAEDADRAHRER